jgi:hypothetical protein
MARKQAVSKTSTINRATPGLPSRLDNLWLLGGEIIHDLNEGSQRNFRVAKITGPICARVLNVHILPELAATRASGLAS